MLTPNYCLIDALRLSPPGSPDGWHGRYLVVLEGETFPPEPLEIHFSSDSLDEALANRDALNCRSFDQTVRGKTFNRYVTTWHTAIREEDARRLCKADCMEWEQVAVTRGLEIVHNDRDFALWSDGLYTRPVSRVPSGGMLSNDAVTLIRRLYRADWGKVEGGPGTLARVAKITQTEVIQIDSLRARKGRHLFERIEVNWSNGNPGLLFTHTTGHFEGYIYEVFQSLEQLKKSLGDAQVAGPA